MNAASTRADSQPFRRPNRSALAAGDVRERHGGRRLATGVTITAAIVILADLLRAVLLAPFYPIGIGPWAAWLSLAAILAVGVASRLVSRSNPLPDWLYVILLVALAVPVWLDVAATWGYLDRGVTPTAAAAAGAVLIPVAAIRGTRVPLAVACAIGVVIATSTLLQAGVAGEYTVVGLAVAVSAVLPTLLAVFAISGFRSLVGRELDLSLVQSTVSTAPSAVGMQASEELAKLDFDAETLLDDVGSGRIAIPLPTAAAERAAAVAARLRARLIEGRTDTWLKHAVLESAYLSNRVVLDDPEGAAGLLSQQQRDGLLLALWLLVGERRKGPAEPISVELRSPATDDDHASPSVVEIDIEVFGVVLRRLDPATWEAVDSVGRHDLVAGGESFRIELECQVNFTSSASATAARSAANPRGS
ncbi:hypothetical protein [Agromyces humatus]|uniref:Uncharacterized protein n=1 Tax=Agromyces humatus TaxID=279573 RepID=A0ABN2K5R1_9MICO|nr:hypothetical protein [Agromyces humatus]